MTIGKFAELRGRAGNTTILSYYANRASFRSLAESNQADCVIVATEDGFSPLGGARRFFAQELGIDERQITDLANWNRFENPDVSLIVLSSRVSESALRGVILAPSETSRCYERFAVPRYGKPYRDFYYGVVYESIAIASQKLSAKRLAISHLSGCGCFHEDIATCTAEALAHYADGPVGPRIEQFAFVGCCIEPHHLVGIQRLNSEGDRASHRPIQKSHSSRDGFEVVTLEWPQHSIKMFSEKEPGERRPPESIKA